MTIVARIRGRLARPGSADPPAGPSDDDLRRALERYGGRAPGPHLGYGTVADLADSRAHLGWLVATSFDMKSLQRCWALKQILASVEPPGPLLEIGAGEPFVAAALARLGYEVTIVDPYDGSGSGPTELAAFRRRYPELTFVRDTYPSAELQGRFAGIYSISVLEHLEPAAVEQAARAATEQADRNIHAIDHVLRGPGVKEHLAGLELLAGAFGVERAELAEVLAKADADPDTYLVSAEAHELWRGDQPYADYPMRRICSVELNAILRRP